MRPHSLTLQAVRLLRKAEGVFVPVHGKHDTHYVKVSKAEARILLSSAAGFAVNMHNGHAYIEPEVAS